VKIVLDTNVLVSGIFWTGIPSKILEYWVKNRFEIFLSDDIFNEYSRTLYRISKGKRNDLVGKWIIFFAQHSSFVEIKKHFSLSVDADDNKFLDCAFSGNVKYIVSGDSDLLDLKSFFGIEIISPAEFLDKL
jgi:uncharacterized protein